MKLFLTLLLSFFVTIPASASDGKKYGEEITLKEKTPISKILETPVEFKDKRVLVEGTVIGVCAKRGCWIKLASDKEYESIIVKVNDGDIVFPIEAKGKTALVEGTIYSVIVENKDHDCDNDKKSDCDSEKKGNVDHKDRTKEIFLIKGLGAVIK